MNISTSMIPFLYPFEVPENSNISSLKGLFHMSAKCVKKLTDENFGTVRAVSPLVGGFYPMLNGDYSLEDALEAIDQLATETNRRFRLGTPLELLLFWLSNCAYCPSFFVVLGKVWDNEVLVYRSDFSVFSLFDCEIFHKGYQVFIVEEFEPPSGQS